MSLFRRFVSLFQRPIAAHLYVGRSGERIARSHLKHLGYRVEGQNRRVGKHDEVDLIAFDPADDALVFVEVKSRSAHSEDFHPELNMDPRKRHALSRAARRYVRDTEYDGGYRMDLLCIASGKVVEHIKDIEWA